MMRQQIVLLLNCQFPVLFPYFCALPLFVLPLYPLDGFRVLSSLAPRSKVTEFLLKYGNYILIGLVLFGTLFDKLDVLGIYIGFVSELIKKLFSLIFGGWTF